MTRENLFLFCGSAFEQFPAVVVVVVVVVVV